jgi:ubiquinone/menaquinone biosynthesis C-methylase UbiE
MPCADSAFDVVVSSECIEHTADPYEAIAEMYRVLRPGGMLILTTPNKLWYPVLLVARKLCLRKFSGPECWTWPHETRRRLEALGFRNVVLSGCHLFPWQLPLARIVLPYLDRIGCILYPIMIN